MAIAATAPIVIFLVLYALIWVIVTAFGLYPFLKESSLAIISIALNFLLIRYFFNTKELHDTGKGLLLITVGWVLIFFLTKDMWVQIHLPGLKFS